MMSNETFERDVSRPRRDDNLTLRAPSERYRMGLRHLMAAVVACALMFWLVQNMGWRVVVLAAVVLPVAAVFGAIVVLIKRRSAQQDGLLWVLSVAAERAMPLGPGVEAYADLCAGGYRVLATRLARLLESGVALPDAVMATPGVLPGDAALLARVGWESGRLTEALRDAVAVRQAQQPYRRALATRMLYLAGCLVAMEAIVAFCLYFIIPKFEAIFADFGVDLPEVTVAVIQVSHFWGSGLALGLLVLVEIAMLGYIPLAYFGYLSGGIPGLEYLTPRRHTAAVLRALATAVDGGRPLTDGLVTLARYYPRAMVRTRAVRVLEDVTRGDDWCRSLQARGLIRRSDAAVLDAARRVGNLPWAMRELAVGIERRLSYRLLVLVQMLFPLVVLALGTVVAVFVVAFFAPLITLIGRMAG